MVETVACEAEGCMGYVTYTIGAHGIALYRRLQLAEAEAERLRAEVENWQVKAGEWKARLDAISARFDAQAAELRRNPE
jgi:hypothetical protein